MDLRSLALVFVGGGLGAVARFAVATVMLQRFGAAFPWGTLAINVLGSFAIGIVIALAGVRLISPDFRVFLAIGVLGGFTTFSTFSYDTLSLINEGAMLQASAYIVASVLGGILAAFLGVAVVRALT